MFTILEYRGHLNDLKIVYVGDGNNIVHSWLRLAQRLPSHFVCACSDNYLPDADTFQRTQQAGISEVEISHDPKTAVKGAYIIYTNVWASMG